MKKYRFNELVGILAVDGRLSNLEELAIRYQVSKRTIQNDLVDVSDFLSKNYGIKLIKKDGSVFFLEGKFKVLKQFKEEYGKRTFLELDESTYRQLFIIKKLLSEQKKLSYQQLSDEFHISKSSIANDLKELKTYVEPGKDNLKTDYRGTYFSGTEYESQKFLCDFIIGVFFNHQSDDKLLVSLCSTFFDEDVLNKVLETLTNFFNDVKVTINMHNLAVIQVSLMVLVGRNKQGHRLSEKIDRDFWSDQPGNMKTYLVTVDLANKMSKAFSFAFSEEDCIYVNKIFIACGVEPITVVIEENKNYDYLIKHAIEKMSTSLSVNLMDDQLLIDGLATHIIPMLYRLKNNIQVKNPLLKQIKERYSVMYGLTWFVMMDMEKELMLTLTEDEIGFVTVHFQAALERQHSVIHVVFVCPNGYGTSSLLASQVKQILPTMDSYELVTLNQLESMSVDHVDFIISTLPVSKRGKNVIKVSPILTQFDVKNILSHYGDWFIERSGYLPKEQANNDVLALTYDLIKDSDLYVDSHFKTKEDVLAFLCSELLNEEAVSQEFIESIYARESLCPTNISNGVAVPHGDPNFVHQSKVKIIVNSHKIPWGEEDVDVMIMLAINKKDVVHVEPMLQKIFTMISDRKAIENYFFKVSAGKLYKTIFEGVYEDGK